MVKGKRLTVRLDEELEAIIDQASVDGNCNKTTVVLSALRRGFAIDGSAVEHPTAADREPYDVYNSTTGCYSRYRATGKLMFHFKPAEKVDGRQYYRDTMGDNPNRKWHRSASGDWIQTIPI